VAMPRRLISSKRQRLLSLRRRLQNSRARGGRLSPSA
jgi:hypothetical protein